MASLSVFFCVLAVVAQFAPIHVYKQTTLRTETFAQNNFSFFWHRIKWYIGICIHRLHIFFLHTQIFAQQFFSSQKSLRTVFFYAQQFLQTNGFYTKKNRTEIIHYIQFFFTNRGVYTDTNCTQKLVHTAHFYTQRTFTQRPFASLV